MEIMISNNVIVDNCLFKENKNHKGKISALLTRAGYNCVIKNCLFEKNIGQRTITR
jgi:hypothetical protein